jgi:hypothetical protein
VTVGPEYEAPRRDAASDAVTVAFGDEGADLYGVARLGLADGAASGLAIVFHGGQPVAVSAEGGVEAAGDSWDGIRAAGLEMTVVEPLRSWRLRYAGAEASLELELDAVGAVAELEAGHPVARAGGMAGYEQPVRVSGRATVGDRAIAVDGLGQRGHSWGAPDWERIGLARTVSAWLGDDLAVSLTAIRPADAEHHEAERVAATIVQRAEGDAPATVAVEDARLSTTYDDDGRQRQAGLELWVDDEWPRRAAGEVVCGTSLDLGRLRLDCAFFRWRMEGRTGVGRYDVLRRA